MVVFSSVEQYKIERNSNETFQGSISVIKSVFTNLPEKNISLKLDNVRATDADSLAEWIRRKDCNITSLKVTMKENEPDESYVTILDSMRVNSSATEVHIAGAENGFEPQNGIPPRRFYGAAVSAAIARILSENSTLLEVIFWLPLGLYESTKTVASSLATNSVLRRFEFQSQV